MHQPKSLGIDFDGLKIDPGRVTTWPCEARNDAQHHRVLRHTEHNRDCCGCSFGGERSFSTAGRRDYSHATLYQVRHHRRQAIIMALQPVVLDYDILTLGITSFAEPLAECGYTVRSRGRPTVDEADHWHRRLLRASSERHGGSAADERDKFASLHGQP